MRTFDAPPPTRPRRSRHLLVLAGGAQPVLPCELDLVLRAEAQQVVAARHAVARLAADAGLDELEIAAVELAVNEACANVVRHAYAPPDPAPSMRVHACADARALVVEVSDNGCGMQPRLAHDAPPRGMGLAIMISVCDVLAVAQSESGTRVTMTFLL